MISDVLSEAVEAIDNYLKRGILYDGGLRDRMVVVRNQMDALRVELDTPAMETFKTKH